jgi:hypothetical protein
MSQNPAFCKFGVCFTPLLGLCQKFWRFLDKKITLLDQPFDLVTLCHKA